MAKAQDMFNLDGKVALVTGSTRGIGRSIAAAFADVGAKVVISSRKADVCAAVTEEFVRAGREAISIPCNIGRLEMLDELVERTLSHWGRIDILVCNAAINPVFGPTASVSPETFDKVMATNVKSVWLLCNKVIPQMAKRRDGSVIVISSIGALRGEENFGLYCVSKAAEVQLVRNLAVEWGRDNVRVNAILPGMVKTDFARALWEDPIRREKEEGKTALRRLGEPEDIAGVALLLGSRAGAFVTGQSIVVDGGQTIA
jgi:NAD(P)-dependent dehydrogenase (short-subunit alcohol dehydrogenase family)